ncbi:hypothetical protein ABPG74_009012 [Tetrahymena malaccensis]
MRRITTKQLFQTIRRSIATNPRDQIINCDPTKMIPGFKPIFKEDKPTKYQVTTLDCGVKVLTEDSAFPFHTDINIVGNFGTRNETQKTGGAMKMLNHLLFMSGDNQSILQNFELNQLNGGGINMHFDQETASYKCQCIPEDTESMLDLLLKTALSPKDFSVFDPSSLSDELENLEFEKIFLKAAYDGKGVGMCDLNPNMTEQDFLDFQNKYITPHRILISGSNVPSHEQFVNLVQQMLKKYPQFLNRKFNPNPYESIYVGKEIRIETESPLVEVGVGFKGVNWQHPDMIIFQIIFSIIGNSSYFSTGGPGKGMHSRATKNLLNRLSYVQGADCICNVFTDSGFFGLKLTGTNESINELVQSCIRELHLLQMPISPIELQRSKNILKSLIHLSLERQQDRLEEAAKHIINFKQIKIDETEKMIDRVTTEDINRVARELFQNSRPTVTMIGEGVNKAMSYDQICRLCYKQ